MKLAITGVQGLIGWHLRCYFKTVEGVKIVPIGREIFSDASQLSDALNGCDAVVHLAGMNRGEEQEVASTNIQLAEQLVSALKAQKQPIHVLFSSSTHIYRDTLYGRSKIRCAELLQEWAEQSGSRFSNIVFPNVFGEHGKPFYNSAVSTFCHQLANGETPKIIQDASIELMHAFEVSRLIHKVVTEKHCGELRAEGHPIHVSELLAKTQELANLYLKNIIPAFQTDFDLQLFNTLRSYLYPKHYPFSLKLHEDQRGSLFESVRTLHGGQAFISTTKPGITRGNHFHFKKVERFCVIQGEATIRIRKLYSNEVREFPVSGSAPQYIDIPTLHTHNITNTGSSELLTLFWSHEIFDPNHPDTYPEVV
jgi:UDP-2-acetamido-2,6-beta-L-arabino-hexul-4-ose reductase